MTQQPNGPCPFGAERQHEWMTRADNGVVECNLCQAAANVRLFAARSDLLEALRDYLVAEDIYNQAVTREATTVAGHLVREKRAAAQAAIAKASPQAQ